jgi:hypothetical protein
MHKSYFIFYINKDLQGSHDESKELFDTLKEFFRATLKDIKVVEIYSKKETNEPTYYFLLIIKCPKLALEEF